MVQITPPLIGLFTGNQPLLQEAIPLVPFFLLSDKSDREATLLDTISPKGVGIYYLKADTQDEIHQIGCHYGELARKKGLIRLKAIRVRTYNELMATGSDYAYCKENYRQAVIECGLLHDVRDEIIGAYSYMILVAASHGEYYAKRQRAGLSDYFLWSKKKAIEIPQVARCEEV